VGDGVTSGDLVKGPPAADRLFRLRIPCRSKQMAHSFHQEAASQGLATAAQARRGRPHGLPGGRRSTASDGPSRHAASLSVNGASRGTEFEGAPATAGKVAAAVGTIAVGAHLARHALDAREAEGVAGHCSRFANTKRTAEDKWRSCGRVSPS
jgi:hypothetical protein